MKKILSLLLALCLVFSVSAVAFAADTNVETESNDLSTYGAAPPLTSVTINNAVTIEGIIVYPSSNGHVGVWVTTMGYGYATSIKYDGEEMSFTLDIRYPKNGDAEVIDDKVINRINSYNFDVLKKTNNKLLYVPKDSELVSKLVKVYEAQTGDKREPIAIGGGTYAKEFPNMVAFGPVFPGEPDVIHQPNERVAVEQLIRAAQVTAAAMYELAKK